MESKIESLVSHVCQYLRFYVRTKHRRRAGTELQSIVESMAWDVTKFTWVLRFEVVRIFRKQPA